MYELYMSALHLVCHPPGQCWRLGWQTVARGDTLPCSESSALARLSSLPCLRHSLTEILPQQHSIMACPHPSSLAMPISLFFFFSPQDGTVLWFATAFSFFFPRDVLFICFHLSQAARQSLSDQVPCSLPKHPQNTETQTGALSLAV